MKVEKITGNKIICSRLYELGVFPGQTIKIISQMPFHGPVIIEVNNTRMALRPQELKCIQMN